MDNEILENSNQFIKLFCLPVVDNARYITRDPSLITNDWNYLINCLSNVDINYVADYIQKQRYHQEFILSPYWYICRNKKLLDDNFLCQIDFNHQNKSLQVHHKSYDYHGFEAQNMNCLTTLCPSCHQLVSKGILEKEPELNGTYRIESLHEKYERLKKTIELDSQIESLVITIPEPKIKQEEIIGLHPYDAALFNLWLVNKQCNEMKELIKKIA